MYRAASIPCFEINTTFFYCLLFFEEHFNPQVRINKMVNIVLPTNLVLQDSPQGCIFPYFYKLIMVLSLSRLFVGFSEKLYWKNLYIPTWLKKSFKLIMFSLLENAFVNQKIESRHFYSCPQAKYLPGYYHHPQTEENYSFPQAFQKFIPPAERGDNVFPWPLKTLNWIN